MKKSRSVCWNITSRCNENCKFCYRLLTYKENTFEENKKILDILIKLNVRKITWTGGEALLYPYLFELMKISHKNGIKNNLITNGRELSKNRIDELEEYLDEITLSYDSKDDNIHNNMGRGIDHGKNVVKILNYIKDNNKNLKVKINTIVTKINVGKVVDIVDIIKNYEIERWKLFKFLPLRGISKENSEEFFISDEEYDKLINKLNEKKSYLNCPIIECKQEEIECNYLLINSIGEFIITENFKDKKIGELENIDTNIVKKYLRGE